MPTGSSVITLATTAKLEQESFNGEPCRMETWTVITKGQVIFKKNPNQKTCYSFNTSTQEVCAPALHQGTALLAKRLLVAFLFFSFRNKRLFANRVGISSRGLCWRGHALLLWTSPLHNFCHVNSTRNITDASAARSGTERKIILEFSITENFPQAYLLKIKMRHKLFKGNFK